MFISAKFAGLTLIYIDREVMEPSRFVIIRNLNDNVFETSIIEDIIIHRKTSTTKNIINHQNICVEFDKICYRLFSCKLKIFLVVEDTMSIVIVFYIDMIFYVKRKSFCIYIVHDQSIK